MIRLALEQFSIDRLAPNQRPDLIDPLGDSLADDPPFTPPEWHLRELERRIGALEAGRSRHGRALADCPGPFLQDALTLPSFLRPEVSRDRAAAHDYLEQ